MNAFERQVLDDLIALQLLLGKATEADKAKGKEQFDEGLSEIQGPTPKLTDAEFEEKLNPQLRVQGADPGAMGKKARGPEHGRACA